MNIALKFLSRNIWYYVIWRSQAEGTLMFRWRKNNGMSIGYDKVYESNIFTWKRKGFKARILKLQVPWTNPFPQILHQQEYRQETERA